MTHPSPLHPRFEDLAATFLPWGPPEAPVAVVESFGEVALEYAAIRKSALLLDLPQRATIEITGGDRLGFLERMLTQKLADMPPYSLRRSFWLNRKGRIDADLRLISLPEALLLDVDLHAAAGTITSLEAFIFTEEVTFTQRTHDMHRLALHGPGAPAVLAAVAETIGGISPDALPPGHAALIRVAGVRIVVDRQDDTGAPGLHMLMPTQSVTTVLDALVPDLAAATAPPIGGARPPVRIGGWAAFNVARIEAGTPMVYVDFGPTSLPHETGVLRDRVHFAKGCYLGQEVVARMESRGHPKQRLIALRFDPATARPSSDWVDLHTGASVYLAEHGDEPVGSITSAAPSPMLGGEPVAFAMVKFSHTEPSTTLWVERTDGQRVAARVQPSLRTLP
ncbi:MAG: aminomethyltransferase family protein [Phycisphaeraceae bacterium]|nr:aminomethyltransferase family protein [Phycisphaeraceae bacterium]